MALKITEECINQALASPNAQQCNLRRWCWMGYVRWNNWADDTKHDPISVDIYYIVADKCNGMSGFHEEPSVCFSMSGWLLCTRWSLSGNSRRTLAKKDKLHALILSFKIFTYSYTVLRCGIAFIICNYMEKIILLLLQAGFWASLSFPIKSA